jgi:hypothetical protein
MPGNAFFETWAHYMGMKGSEEGEKSRLVHPYIRGNAAIMHIAYLFLSLSTGSSV